jgi:hypothetical protein
VSTFAARSSAALARVAIAAIGASLPAAAAAQGLYLHEIPTHVAGVPSPGDGARIRLFAARPGDLAAWLPGARAIDAESSDLPLGPYPELDPQVAAHHTSPSFVIDFDEPAVQALVRELVRQHGATPSLDALSSFARAAIPTPSMERGWDIASRVARSGTGDCTEHAVLLAALARAVGLPARVATGIAIVRVAGAAQGFGHAWTEIHDGSRWVPVDATPLGDPGDVLARVPLALVEDEGPGYAMGLARQLQRRWIRRLEIHAAAAAPASR